MKRRILAGVILAFLVIVLVADWAEGVICEEEAVGCSEAATLHYRLYQESQASGEGWWEPGFDGVPGMAAIRTGALVTAAGALTLATISIYPAMFRRHAPKAAAAMAFAGSGVLVAGAVMFYRGMVASQRPLDAIVWERPYDRTPMFISPLPAFYLAFVAAGLGIWLGIILMRSLPPVPSAIPTLPEVSDEQSP